MIDYELNPNEDEFETTGDDGGADDDLTDDIEVAPSAPEIPEADDAPPPPPPPPGPRTFKEHYSILLGASMLVVSGLAVWERHTVYGVEVRGTQSVAVSFMLAFALYTVGVGISNIATGRLRGMGATFLAGIMGLWMGIKGFLAFNSVDGFMGWSDYEEFLKDPDRGGGYNMKLQIEGWLSQWGPGVWLATIGGAMITWVFVKAIFGGKKKDAAKPAAASGRGGRRR